MNIKHITLFTISMSMLFLNIGNINAQKPDNNRGKDEKVVVVDDESCGCELVFIDGIQTIERNGLFGFKREDGTVFVEPQYMFVDKFHGDYCIVYKDYQNCGMIDRNGRIIVPVEFDAVNYPTDGMIRVCENGLYGFYDTSGHKVIDFHYRTTSGFNEGLAAVIIDFDSLTSAYGYINKKDSLVIPATFEYAMTFEEGYAVVKQYDRYGMIDRKGDIVFPTKYIELSSMHNGRFFAVDALSGEVAMFDNRFRQLTPFKYEKLVAYSEGLYIVERNGQQTFLDLKGKERFGWYDNVGGFYDGFSMVSRGGKYGIINSKGKTILPIEYDNSGYREMEYIFSEGLAMIEKDGKYGFINKRGDIAIPLVYNSAFHCTEGLIPVEKGTKWGYIDREGNVVCPFVFESASFFTWDRAEVVYNGNVSKINSDGICVKACANYPSDVKFKFKDR